MLSEHEIEELKRLSESWAVLSDERGRASAFISSLISALEEARKEINEIKAASLEWLEETGQMMAYVGIRDYAAACQRAEEAEKDRDALLGSLVECEDDFLRCERCDHQQDAFKESDLDYLTRQARTEFKSKLASASGNHNPTKD